MNGQEVQARILGQSSLEIRYQLQKRSGKSITSEEPTENVFSVTDSTGTEKIWYFHDPEFGNEFTVPQMRSFIKGEQDARLGYKPLWTTLGGFAAGAGLTIAMDLEVMSLTIPPIYAGLMALPRIYITRGSIRDPLMEGNEEYAYGYAQVGRSKRVIRGLLSSFAGVATGLAVRQLIINP